MLFIFIIFEGIFASEPIVHLNYYPSNSRSFWIVFYHGKNDLEFVKFVSLGERFHNTSNLNFGEIDCDSTSLCDSETIPNMRIFYEGFVSEYDGEFDVDLMAKWINESIENNGRNIKTPPLPVFLKSGSVIPLLESSLNNVTNNSNTAWIVMIYKHISRKNRKFTTNFHSLSEKLRVKKDVKFGYIVCTTVSNVDPIKHSKVYERFFRDQKRFFKPGGYIDQSKIILERVFELIKPKSVCDIGCGNGYYLEGARQFSSIGRRDLVGFDFQIKAEALLINPEQYHDVDLSLPLFFERKFDLCISVEVSEHISADCAETFVKNLVSMAPVVMFTGAIPRQGHGLGHLNEQWPQYWEERFLKHHYYAVDILRTEFWNNPKVIWYLKQNLILYVREDMLLSFGFEKPKKPLFSYVHPETFRIGLDEAYRQGWKEGSKGEKLGRYTGNFGGKLELGYEKKALNDSLCNSKDVNVGPVVKLFKGNSSVTYSGRRDESSLALWLNQNLPENKSNSSAKTKSNPQVPYSSSEL